MPFRSPAALFAALLLTVVTAGPGRAADFTDSAGRRVLLPDHIDRVLTAGPTADVLVFVLAPESWSAGAGPRRRPICRRATGGCR